MTCADGIRNESGCQALLRFDLGGNSQHVHFSHSLYENVCSQIVSTSEWEPYNNIVNDSRVEYES